MTPVFIAEIAVIVLFCNAILICKTITWLMRSMERSYGRLRLQLENYLLQRR